MTEQLSIAQHSVQRVNALPHGTPESYSVKKVLSFVYINEQNKLKKNTIQIANIIHENLTEKVYMRSGNGSPQTETRVSGLLMRLG